MKFYNSLLAIATLVVIAAGMDRIVDAAGAPPPSMGFLLRAPRVKPAIWAA